MDEKSCIEVWDDSEELVSRLPFRVRVPILKKMQYYRNYTVNQLKNKSKYLEKIEAVNSHIVLWELKFPSDPPYRFVCLIKEHRIIVLEIFQGSGSDGKVRKRVPQALKKAEAWYRANNQ